MKRLLLVLTATAAIMAGIFVPSAKAAVTRPADNTGTYTVFQIINWDGGCLDITTATVGQRLKEATCGSPGDLWWEYNSGASAGQLSPQGHPGLSAGDAGGLLELRTAPSTAITYDATQQGYLRTCFAASGGGCVSGTYWHGNQAGNNVTLISQNSNADYWRFAPVG